MAKSRRERFGKGPGELGSYLRQMMTGNQEPQVDDFEGKLNEALERTTKSTELQNKIEALLKLKGQGGSNNPLAALKEAGIDLQSLLGTNNQQMKTLADIADKERKARIESEEKALDFKRENKTNEMQMFMKIMEMQQQTQKEQINSFKNILTDLKDEIKEIKSGKSKNNDDEDDPVRQASKKLVNQALDEKLNSQPPDPVSSIMHYADRIQQMKDILGANSSDIDKQQLDLQHQLQLKKIELEDKWRREEAEQQRKIEEQKLQRWDGLMQNMQQILPAIAQTLANNKEGGQKRPQDNIVICRNCGQQIDANNIPENCPNCNASFVEPQTQEDIGEAENE